MKFEDGCLYIRGETKKDVPRSSPDIVRNRSQSPAIFGNYACMWQSEIINSLVNYYLHILWSVALA
jgi:hypothetical protein